MIEPFKPCEVCKDSGAAPGYLYVRLPNGTSGLTECDCHKRWKAKQTIKIEAAKANLWSSDEILNYNPIKDYKGNKSRKNVLNLQKFIENFNLPEFNSASIYMYGPNGTQKTYLAQWLGLSLLQKKVKVKYMLMNQLVTKLSSSFDNNPEKVELLEDLAKIDCLILDESFARDKVTIYKSGFQIPFLDSFLRERSDTLRKSIVYVSNIAPTDIASEGFTDSIQSLVLRKTKPLNAIFEMKDVYMSLISSFESTAIFD